MLVLSTKNAKKSSIYAPPQKNLSTKIEEIFYILIEQWFYDLLKQMVRV